MAPPGDAGHHLPGPRVPAGAAGCGGNTAAPGPATADEGSPGPAPGHPAAAEQSSSTRRKQALRQLADEQRPVYRELYAKLKAQAPGLTRDQARGRALTLLGRRFPGRYHELRSPSRHADGPSQGREWAAARTARVLTWMEDNCHRRDVTIAEVAEVASLSPRHLQTVFKREFGRSPLQKMADIRLHRVHLALTGQAPAPASIAEAARQAGHSRVTRFENAYRDRYGTYPALPAPVPVGTSPQADTLLRPDPTEQEDGRRPSQ